MRLQKVKISRYKNLEDFSLSFDGEHFIDLFVGKNASGKSNFFEALVQIFNHFYERFSIFALPGFDYEVHYIIGTDEVKIVCLKGDISVTVNGEDTARKDVRFPDNVIVYYSGHNSQIANMVHRYEERFRPNIREAKATESPALVGIGPLYKQLLILLMLLLPEENKAQKLLREKLGILGHAVDVDITITRPYFATKSTYDHLDPKDLFWGASGITKDFLINLASCIKGGVTLGALHNREKDHYTFKVNFDLFRKVFSKASLDQVFRYFNNLKILNMLGDIQLKLTLQGIETSELDIFSDGQFQSVYIFAISEVFREIECLTLLDEPDAFLHPEWQYEFLTQANLISQEAKSSNHVLVSSHSAATLIKANGSGVKFFDLKDSKVNCYAIPKRVAIKNLSSDIIKYTESEQILSIINAIQIENKPVFFTEGATDPLVIKEAWSRLYDREIPFIPFYAFSSSYLKQLLMDSKVHAEMDGLPMFGLFDFDKAYDSWNSMGGEVIQNDPVKGLTRKLKDLEGYAFMLPLPNNEEIRAQVLNGTDHFGGASLCEMEHLFFGDPLTESYFTTEPVRGGGHCHIFKSDGKKAQFLGEIIPKLEDKYFQPFKPIFDFVLSKIEEA